MPTGAINGRFYNLQGSSWQEAGQLTFLGDWDTATPYTIGAVTTYAGNEYVAAAETTGDTPDTSPTVWTPLAAAGPSGVIAVTAPITNSGTSTSATLGAALAAPALTLGTATAAGTAGTLVRSDATLVAFDAVAPSTQAVGDSAAIGTVALAARRDHAHGMPSFATPTLGLGTAAATGTATTLLRSDATLAAFDTTAPVTQALGDAAAVGTVAKAARRDHAHGLPAFAIPSLSFGTAVAAGTAVTPFRSDATLAIFDTTAPTTQAVGDAAAVGTVGVAARRDHAHGWPAFATPAVVLGTAGAAGTATTLLRSNATLAAFDATTPAGLTVGGSGAVGAAAVAARRDHAHAITALALADLPTITQRIEADGSTVSPTSTSAAYVDLTDMSITLTTVGGDVLVLFDGDFYDSSTGVEIDLGLVLDGAGALNKAAATIITATYLVSMSFNHLFTGLSAASHTIKVQWATSGGTVTNYSRFRHLLVIELAK